MFSLEEIQEIYQRAESEKWPYHYLFNSLKSIGVERYEVNVKTHGIKYVGEGSSILSGTPENSSPVIIGATFNLEALKSAIEKVQRRETSYPQFLAEIAAAGVSFYRVDMKPRTVTYHGPTPKDKYVEIVLES